MPIFTHISEIDNMYVDNEGNISNKKLNVHNILGQDFVVRTVSGVTINNNPHNNQTDIIFDQSDSDISEYFSEIDTIEHSNQLFINECSKVNRYYFYNFVCLHDILLGFYFIFLFSMLIYLFLSFKLDFLDFSFKFAVLLFSYIFFSFFYCLNLFIYNTLSHYYLSKFVIIKNLTVGDLYYQLSPHTFSDKLIKICYPKFIVHV